MSASLIDIFAKWAGRIPVLGKPLAATGAGLGRLAADRVDGILGTARPRFAAFISYSHHDMTIARWLHKAVETFHVPRALVGTDGEFGTVPSRLRPVFRDEEELAGAEELGPKLLDALTRSNALIVLCSPAAAQSIWVDREIRTFKRRNPDKPVFAVIVSGTPGGDDECFPPALRFALDARGELDCSRALEPLAPDLQKLDRKRVKLKLIAGLLGIDYGRLRNREQLRRRQLTAIIGSAATILIIALTALSIVAVTYAGIAVRARNVALQARKSAIIERNAAVAARDLAERRLWLAQRSAEEVRYQSDLAADAATCKTRR